MDNLAATPLRSAVIWCVELRPGKPVALGALATIANVEGSRAKAYASILLARGALVQTDSGLIPGPAWTAWRAEPGGRAKYSGSPAAESMDAMRSAMAVNIKALTASRGWTHIDLARKAGVACPYLKRLFMRSEPLPATACVLVARALGTSVEQLVQRPASFR